MTSEILREEQQRVKAEYCSNVFEEILKKAANVLKCGINILIGDDFPVLWAELYRQSKAHDSIANLDTLLNSIQDKEAKEKIRKTKQPRKVPNEATVNEVRTWLEGLQADQLRSIRKELVYGLDVHGTVICLLYADFPSEDADSNNKLGILLKRIFTKYAIERKWDYKNSLETFRINRNAYKGHDGDTTWENLQDNDINNFIANVKDVVAPFRKDTDSSIKSAIVKFDECINEAEASLRAGTFMLSELAGELNFPEENLGNILGNSKLSARLSRSAGAIFYTAKQEILKIFNNLRSAMGVATDSGASPEGFVSTKRWTPFNKIKKYISGKLSNEQLEELAEAFSFIVAKDYLLSEEGLNTVAYVLGPILAKTKSRLIVDWATLAHLYMMENSSSDPQIRKQAHAAKITLYTMHKRGMIWYVGSVNSGADPDESLCSFISKYSNDSFCLLTKNGDLAELVNSPNTPNCISLTSWRDDAFMVRTSAKDRLSQLCSANAENRQEPTDKSTASSSQAAANADAAPALAPEKEPAPVTKEENAVESIPERMTYPAPSPERKAPPILFNGTLPSEGFVSPTTGSTLMDAGKKSLRLLDKIGSEGGEGTVYKTDRPGFAAKIYHADKITQSRMDKLTYMCRLPISRHNLCWPETLLYSESGVFVGFLMTIACDDAIEMGRSIFKLSGDAVRQKLLPEWNRMSLARLCVSVSDTFAYLHRNNILMGDVNPRNLLVSISRPHLVYFVDCDSYQVGSYNCPVGMVEYSSPEYLLRLDNTPGGYAKCPRTIEDEGFALASLLFRILMLGQSPFAAKNSEEMQQSLRKYSFAYKTKENDGRDVPDVTYSLIWNNTPRSVRDLFADVFTGGKKHSAETWRNTFQRYEDSIKRGQSTDRLLPKKYYDATGNFVDFICASCGVEANIHKDTYERLTRINHPLLCNACRAAIERDREIPADLRCSKCGIIFKGTMHDKALMEYGKRYYCYNCRATRESRFSR